MKSRNILSDVERAPVGNDPLDLYFKKFTLNDWFYNIFGGSKVN